MLCFLLKHFLKNLVNGKLPLPLPHLFFQKVSVEQAFKAFYNMPRILHSHSSRSKEWWLETHMLKMVQSLSVEKIRNFLTFPFVVGLRIVLLEIANMLHLWGSCNLATIPLKIATSNNLYFHFKDGLSSAFHKQHIH